MGVTLNSFSLFLSGWSVTFNTPVSTLALAFTVFSLGCSAFAIPAGWAADRYPARRVIGLGLVGVTLVHALMGFVGASWQIIAIYALILPVAVSFTAGIPCQAVVTRWFQRRRGTALGLCAFGLAAAGVIFPPIITLLLREIGWRETWWVFAVFIGLVCLPAVVLVLRDRPGDQEGLHYVGGAQPAPAADLSIGKIFARPRFWAILGVFLPVQFVSAVASINMAPIAQHRDLSLETAGLLLSIYSASALVGKFVSGMMADRFGNRLPFALVAALAACGALLLGTGDGVGTLTAAALALGLSQGHWTLLASTTASEFGTAGFGKAYGAICAFTPIGSLAPPAVAWIAEHGGGYAASLTAFALVAVCGCGVAWMTLSDRPQDDRKSSLG